MKTKVTAPPLKTEGRFRIYDGDIYVGHTDEFTVSGRHNAEPLREFQREQVSQIYNRIVAAGEPHAAKIDRELALLERMTQDDMRATVLYYREKLRDIAANDCTARFEPADGQMTPAEIANALLEMRECPVGQFRVRSPSDELYKEAIAELQQTKEQLAALRAARADERNAEDELIEQAELTAIAIADSGNDRLIELEGKELKAAVDRWHEQREAWHDLDDDEDFSTSVLDEALREIDELIGADDDSDEFDDDTELFYDDDE